MGPYNYGTCKTSSIFKYSENADKYGNTKYKKVTLKKALEEAAKITLGKVKKLTQKTMTRKIGNHPVLI